MVKCRYCEHLAGGTADDPDRWCHILRGLDPNSIIGDIYEEFECSSFKPITPKSYVVDYRFIPETLQAREEDSLEHIVFVRAVDEADARILAGECLEPAVGKMSFSKGYKIIGAHTSEEFWDTFRRAWPESEAEGDKKI